LIHTSSSFCSGYFGDVVSQSICPGWPQTTILPISISWVIRITGMSHQCTAWYLFYLFFYHTWSKPHAIHPWIRQAYCKSMGQCFEHLPPAKHLEVLGTHCGETKQNLCPLKFRV
jgi:hypothetical protein